MVLQTFYQTVAQLSFTLLGLWWLVLQTKYQEWIGSPVRRRMVTSISLYFLVPGGMSLFALVSVPNHTIWQAAFAVAGCIGMIVAVVFVLDAARMANTNASAWTTLLAQVARVVSFVLYGGIVVVALIPGIASSLGVVPLMVEGTLVSVLVVLGLALAWAYFIEPVRPAK
jgi:hypothetical protein